MFVNAQKNLRQFIPYAAGSNFYGSSPWSLGTQAAFDLFKTTVHPETSWTYELGVRTHRDLDLGALTGIEGQASYLSRELLQPAVSTSRRSTSSTRRPSILVNVGGVTTDGVDVAATLHFGEHFHVLRRALLQQLDL